MYIVILGMGEVGQAVATVLERKHHVFGQDLDVARQSGQELQDQRPDTLHIAIRWSDDFFDAVASAIERHKPHGVVVHSTVPVGTTQRLSLLHDRLPVAHAPIRGVHPNMTESLLTFPMALSGDARLGAGLAAAGIEIHHVGARTESTELMKLLDLTYYAWNIAFAKESARLIEGLGLDYDQVYRWANETYNTGYQALGRPEVVRPVLDPVPGPIGGHCVVPGFKMLANDFQLADFLAEWHAPLESERHVVPLDPASSDERPIQRSRLDSRNEEKVPSLR